MTAVGNLKDNGGKFMKFKKLISLATVMVVTSGVLVGCSGKDNSETDETIKIGMVADVGGINDRSFNQSAYEGLKKAEKELGIEVQVVESKQQSEYISNIEELVDGGMDLVIGVGNTMKDAIEEQAKNYPDQQFAIVDESYDTIPSNVTPILFKEQEAAYLEGLIAGRMTKTNNVGFIGGMKNPIIERFEYGYKAGVNESNKDAKVQVQYANAFNDQAKGKSIASQMYHSDTDVILTAAGDTGLGVIEAAKEKSKYVIGVDRDQSEVAPENVLSSALKRVDMAVYDISKNLVEGKLNGGEAKIYGLKEDGVGISETTKNLVPEEILTYVNGYVEKIKNEDIVVPSTKEEFEKLTK